MKVRIRFRAEYRYEEPVSFSIHLFRLFPRAGRDLRVRRADFETNSDAVVTYRRDLFDNEVASAWYPEKAAMLFVKLRLEVELEEGNPFAFLLHPSVTEFPFRYEEPLAALLAPYLQAEAAPELPFWKPPEKPQPTVAALVELNRAFREHLQYERREEGEAHAPAETVRRGGGACRDFALLLAATLRRNGVAARLASGYLVESAGADRVAEGALHAWTEAYLPGAGWVGFDPTNGTLCNHLHITAAVGLTPEHIAPTLGRYFADRVMPSRMKSSLVVEEAAPRKGAPEAAPSP
jgi:transglutaminase-like putative cysteine protease